MENSRPKISKDIYKKIEKDVTSLYIKLNLRIPLKPFEIADKLGYIVFRLSSVIESMEDSEKREILKKLKERDGYSFYEPKIDRYIICVNDIGVATEERNEFTVMHEIGHIRMGHKCDSQLAEEIANYYAAYSLAPTILIKYYKCTSYKDVRRVFKISDKCARLRYRRFLSWEKLHSYTASEKELLSYYE
jgi:Zn-dependent peptidase ImmA (M78 family)